MIRPAPFRQLLGSLVEDLGAVSAAAKETSQAVRDAAGDTRRSAEQAAAAVEGAAERVEGSSRSLRASLESAVERTDDLVAQLETRHATRIDDLRDRLAQSVNTWNGALEEALDALEDGSLRFEEFIQEFGDWTVGAGDAAAKVEDLLKGFDPREFRDRSQQIQRALRQDLLSLDDIMEQLARLQNRYAQELLRILKLYRDGRATLEEVLRAARQAQSGLGDDGLTSTLADGLEDALRQAQLSGEI